MEEERKYYEDIVEAKEDIQNGMYDDAIYYGAHKYFDFLITVMKSKMSIRKKYALLTVLTTGSYVDGTRYTWLNMPATSYCCDSYRETAKQIRNGYIEALVYREFTDRYEIWRISVLRDRNAYIYHQHAKQYNKRNKAYLHKRRCVRW